MSARAFIVNDALQLETAESWYTSEFGFGIDAKFWAYNVIGGPSGLPCVELRFGSDSRGEPLVKPIKLCSVLLRFKPKIRNRAVTGNPNLI